MFFKTLKTSETGNKFKALLIEVEKTNDAQKVLANKYGFKKWRAAEWPVWGGFSSCIFLVAPDMKIWKKTKFGNDEYMPRMTSKEGKVIGIEFKEMPVVERNQLNECIGKVPFLKTIGFSGDTNKNQFGFIVGDNWKVKIPSDCTEITKTEYDKLFKE